MTGAAPIFVEFETTREVRSPDGGTVLTVREFGHSFRDFTQQALTAGATIDAKKMQADSRIAHNYAPPPEFYEYIKIAIPSIAAALSIFKVADKTISEFIKSKAVTLKYGAISIKVGSQRDLNEALKTIETLQKKAPNSGVTGPKPKASEPQRPLKRRRPRVGTGARIRPESS